jgi:hypothetical protein
VLQMDLRANVITAKVFPIAYFTTLQDTPANLTGHFLAPFIAMIIFEFFDRMSHTV